MKLIVNSVFIACLLFPLGCSEGVSLSEFEQLMLRSNKARLIIFAHSVRGDFSNYATDVISLINKASASSDYKIIEVVVSPTHKKNGFSLYHIVNKNKCDELIFEDLSFAAVFPGHINKGIEFVSSRAKNHGCYVLILLKQELLQEKLSEYHKALNNYEIDYRIAVYSEDGRWSLR